MNIKIVIDIAIVVFLVVAGYSQIAKGRAYVSSDKFTAESIRAFSKPMGLLTWLFAVSLTLIFAGQAGVFPAQTSTYMMYVGDVAVVITMIAYLYASKKILKRKKTSSMHYKAPNNKRKM